MSTRSELDIKYDEHMNPLTATCKLCGEKMASPNPKLNEPFEIILWFSELYLKHRSAKHGSADNIPAFAQIALVTFGPDGLIK